MSAPGRVLRRASLALAFVAATGLAAETKQRPGPPSLPSPSSGFELAVIARVPAPRQLTAAPNGDLIVGTAGRDVYIVPAAEDEPQPARVFAHARDNEAAGVAFGGGFLFIGTEHGVWRLPYRTGDRVASAPPLQIASVRTGGGGDHVTTSLAATADRLYASVGSSCNACIESDPTRATVQQLAFDGSAMRPAAIHIRNAIALAVNPATGAVWAGVAGQDELAHGHPYEIFDPVTMHAGTPDYGWPECYEDRRPVRPGIDCSNAIVARVAFPAYATPTGAAFYSERQAGTYAFPNAYRGGAFVTLHGSWHKPPVAPGVVFVALRGDEPARPVDWSDPGLQSSEFVRGFQIAGYGRIGRPSGIAVGPQGSLFVSDDLAGAIYRIRPEDPRR